MLSTILMQNIYLLSFLQENVIEVPTDISIWQGLSLALVFNIVTTLLRAVKIIPDGPIKKSLGLALMIIGMIVGAAYAYSSDVSDLMEVFKLVAGGGAAGLLASGSQSAVKNFREGLAMLQAKKQ